MSTHDELLNSMATFREALSARFKWFVHETPFPNLTSIRSEGLLPMQDALPPADVESYFGSRKVPILCLHPHGSALIPKGAANSLVIPLGGLEPKRVKLAVSSQDLPIRVGLDWSYSWEIQKTRFQRTREKPLEVQGCEIADEFGSIVSYELISANLLKVCKVEMELSCPKHWACLKDVEDGEIALFD